MSRLSHFGQLPDPLPHPAQILAQGPGSPPVRLPDMHRRSADGDAVAVLLDGLLAGRELISRYQRLLGSPGFGPVARVNLARQLCAELAVQLHIEQEIFHAALRLDGLRSEAMDLAEVGREVLQTQVVRLSALQAEAPLFDARVQMVAQLFDLHLHLSLTQLFPLARQSALDLPWLGAVLVARRAELLDELRQPPGH